MMTLTDRFKALGTAPVSDVLDEAGFHRQTMDPSRCFIGSPISVCGPAVCVRGERSVVTRTTGGNTATLPLYNLPTLAQPGAMMVFATTGFRGGGVTGELLALDLQSSGVAGLIKDGLVRDRDALSAIDMPVVSAGVIPVDGAWRFQITSWDGPVTMPGTEGSYIHITPGDLVLADSDGVLVIPAMVVDQIIELAEELFRKETALKQAAHSQPAEERAKAQAKSMSHMVWLRNEEMSR